MILTVAFDNKFDQIDEADCMTSAIKNNLTGMHLKEIM
jgi:hypothetical protein